MSMFTFDRMVRSLSVVACALVLVACGGREATTVPPVPTNTPLPTFTPTPEIVVTPVDAGAAATTQALQAASLAATAQANQAATDQAAGQQVDTPTTEQEAPTDTPVPPTPTPAAASVVTNQGMNIRQGPGINYPIVGAAQAGERFAVLGRNPAGDWWQINFNGQPAWLFASLVQAQNTDAVAVAVNIPAPPPPTNTPIPAPPTATPVPAAPPPPAEPTPVPQPVSNYKFNVAVVGRCDPNGGVTYAQGRTYVGGQPQSGDWSVAFSYAPDGPVVAKVKVGPHPGYEGWDQGFWSHILQSDGPRQGNWWFWVVDPAGNRISELANVNTDGDAGPGKCQQAVVDFDSR